MVLLLSLLPLQMITLFDIVVANVDVIVVVVVVNAGVAAVVVATDEEVVELLLLVLLSPSVLWMLMRLALSAFWRC